MLIALFFIKDNEEKSRFFENISLLLDISIDIALRMSFLNLSNVKIEIFNGLIDWKTFNVIKVLLTRRKVELIEKKEFAI